MLNTTFFQETPSSHFLPLVSSVLLHVPFLGRPYETAGRRLETTSPKPAPPTASPVLPKNQHFLGQFPTKRFPGFISELSRVQVCPTCVTGTVGMRIEPGLLYRQPAGWNHLSTPVGVPRVPAGFSVALLSHSPLQDATGDKIRSAGPCSFTTREDTILSQISGLSDERKKACVFN